jgi:hypothetical protein
MSSSALVGIGKMIAAAGVVLTLAGLLVYGIGRLSGTGQSIPGDFTFRWGNTTLYLPLATSIIVSIILGALVTLGIYVAGWLRH